MLSWLSSDDFIPHGHCFLWRPDILWLQVGSDGLIAAAYFSIPVMLAYVVRRRHAVLPYWWVGALFAAFIFLCGSTHLLAIWTIWHPDYAVDGVVKLATGLVSAATAITLAWIMPQALQLRTPIELEHEIARQTADLRAANARLRDEVAHRESTERALRESEERYRLAARAVRGFLYDWTIDDDRVTVSEGFATLLGGGLEPGAANGSGWLARVHPEDLGAVRAAIGAHAGTDCERIAVEYRVRNAAGEYLWVADHAVLVRDASGRVIRAVGSIIEITDRKSAEAELRRVDAELREAARRKDQFLAILAHELRNPLAPVRNALQILKLAEHDPRRVAATREMMERQVSHMVRLIDDLMDVSRLTRDRLELQRVDTSVAQVLDAAIETCRPGIEAAGHRLEVTLPAEPLPLHADRLRLAQVFGNLVSNSCKFMEPGGSIRIEARSADGDAVVTVSDSGFGIAAEDLPNVFEMFTQVRREHGARNGGLGIGLALVRSLVTLHGGSVAACSAGPGQGATFVVRLPLAEHRVAGEPAAKRALLRRPAAQSLRVVVADDNRDAAESLATILATMGHEVRIAADGREAVALAEALQPDILFMDLSMPHLDGLDAARRIRARPWGKRLVICALTGFSHEQDRQRSIEAGMDLHLVKPVDPEALSAVLSRP